MSATSGSFAERAHSRTSERFYSEKPQTQSRQQIIIFAAAAQNQSFQFYPLLYVWKHVIVRQVCE